MLENNLSGTPILYGEIQRQVLNLGKEEQHKVVEPQREDVEVLPDSLRYALGSVLVKGVTASIDENIKPENIKLGTSILGVEGNVAPDKPDQEKTIYPSEEEQVVVADVGYELGRVISKPVETESLEILPTKEKQTINASEGKYIKQFEVLGVETEELNVVPTTEKQTFTPSENKFFDKVSVGEIENLDPELTVQETLLAELEEGVNGLSDKDDTALKILDGTLEEFDNTKLGLTQLMSYRFNGFTNLKKANFKGIKDIPEYTCENCSNLTDLVLDPNTESIGEYAFINCPLSNFVLRTNKTCNVDQYAFRQSGISGIDGELGNVGAYAFYGLSSAFTLINATINGTIGTSAFQGCYYVDDFKINKESIVSGAIGDYAFSGVGSSRSNPQNSVFDLDFSNSSISVINQYAFGTSSSSYKNRYYNIKFPSTLKTINSYAFRYSDNLVLYFKGQTPATLNSNAFNNATNLKICVNYASINDYKTATNWVAYASSIVGYADRNTFAQGQQLPQYSISGYELTWYSDIGLTQQVTTADNPENYYYCTQGETQVDVVGITSLYQYNCKIEVTNSLTGHKYTEGEGILIGTQLTITATPTIQGYVPYILTFNGVEFTSPLSYTTVSGTNINLIGIYYNGVDVPANPDLNQNSWAIIKKIIQDGNAGQYWTVGQIKEIEIDGLTYGIRLSDLQLGRYNYASGTKTTNAVFEFVQLYNTSYRMNETNTNAGGWATAELQTIINSTILDKIPMELRNLLEEVVVASANGGSSNYTAITTSNNKLFLPCAKEVNVSSSYGRVDEGTTWDYYVNAGNSLRIKTKPNTTSATHWWLRSPYPTLTDRFSFVSNLGSGNYEYARNSGSVCPCFAW